MTRARLKDFGLKDWGLKTARLCGYLLFAASLVYFSMAFWHHAGQLPPIAWTPATFVHIAVAVLVGLVPIALGGFAWHLWLKSVGERSRPAVAMSLSAFSQVAKYVPGSIAQHIARLGLGKRHGLHTQSMVATFGLEAAWTLAAGIVVGILGISLSRPELGTNAMESLSTIPSGWVAAVSLAAVLAPIAAIWLARHVQGRLGRWDIRIPDLKTLAACFLIYAANLAICGWIVAYLADHVFGSALPAARDWLAVIGTFSIAWALGFVALLSPGGLGVREAVLFAGLSPLYGPGTAIGVAILYRVVTSIVDGLSFLIGLASERHLFKTAAKTPA